MSHFAKRHYEAIATALQNIHPGSDMDTIDYDARLKMWNDIRSEIATMFARDNSRFIYDRFEHACKPGSNVKAKTAHLKVA